MEENTNEKKKQVRLAIIGVVALLLLTLGATFAYFLIDTDSSTSKSSIKGDIEDIDSIALQKVTENLHVNLSAADMAEANKNTEYFGDDDVKNNYVKTVEEGFHTLGRLTAEGGNGTTRYMCTANAVVTMQVASESDMGKYFETGDAYLYLNAGSLQQKIDLSELKASGTLTIPFEIAIQSEGERQLEGYVEIINRDADQTYLENKTLNIDVKFEDLDCNVGVSEVETYLRKYDKENKLTANLINGLYRYQGNSIANSLDVGQAKIIATQTVNDNYICLGSDCNENGQNLYRILGVTEDGLMKVIKITSSKEDVQWWTDNKTDIAWPQSLAYQYLNTDFYNGLPIELKNKIVEVTWKYGDVDTVSLSPEEMNDYNSSNESLETLESEFSDYFRNISSNVITKYCGDIDDNNCLVSHFEEISNELKEELSKNEIYQQIIPLAAKVSTLQAKGYVNKENESINKVNSKISLMSITDYISSFESNKDINIFNFLNNLIEMGIVDYMGLSWLTTLSIDNPMVEWSMSRIGNNNNSYSVWALLSILTLEITFENKYTVRPVFFLTSDIELSGEGTIARPFTIGIE